MKIIDKFLKLLKTDRNTFATYILTLLTLYLTIDRIAELLIMIFTGIGCSYWTPIQYALAFACPIFAFLFSCSSKFAKSEETKLSFFYLYVVTLYILIISMFTQILNGGCWTLLLSMPAYPSIVRDSPQIIAPAFRSISLYLPLTTFYPVIKWLITTVRDTPDIVESIYDYSGINLTNKVSPHTGEYSCEIKLCIDKTTGKSVKISEDKRFESMLVVGISGSGKTSLIFEPMIARDIEKKYFYKKTSKEFAFAALKSGIANLNCPYDNEYINDNFSLNMISPNPSKLATYKSCMKKLIYDASNENIIYKNLGLTYVSPDIESISRIQKVAKNYHVTVNLIDPNSTDSIGLNPFVYDNPSRISVIVSTALKNLYSNNSHSSADVNMNFMENISIQAIENTVILFKIMYPRMHNDDLPTLQDMLDAFNNFDIIQNMCEQMETEDELVKDYSSLIAYFKKYFYINSQQREATQKYITPVITALDNLLRFPNIRNILCNRTNNVNFDNVLQNGEVNLLCTRRGDLGAAAHTAFGLFFLLSMQYAILRRPGTEATRIPHFLYIDEFADFICDSTDSIFTLYRKYKIGTVISIHNLDQLNTNNSKHRKTIVANCAHKVVFGNNEPDDNEWWSKELGTKNKWTYSQSYDLEKGEYSKNLSGIKSDKVPKYKVSKIQNLKFKQCFYKVRDSGGKNNVGIGILNFLDSKYKENQIEPKLNFEKFTNGMSEGDTSKRKRKKNTLPTFVTEDDSDEEIDPIRSNNLDSIFDNFKEGEAIINPVNTKKNNN